MNYGPILFTTYATTFAILWPTFAIIEVKYLSERRDIDMAVMIGLGAAFVWPLTLVFAAITGIVHLATRKDGR